MKQEHETPESKTEFLRLELRGQITTCDRTRLQALTDHLTHAVADMPPSPCAGGVLLVRQVSWRCIGDRWNLIEVNTWQCPDGAIVERENWIQATDDPCGAITA